MSELIVENGQPVEVRDDGSKVYGYVWDGKGGRRCPTEICGAYCCKTASLFPSEKPPCPFLTERLSCSFQDKGGMGAKPYGCVMYPRSQADIDSMNKDAPEGGGCQLRMEKPNG